MKRLSTALLALLAFASPPGANAQVAVSGNDGKQPHLGDKPHDVTPDEVAVIDMAHYPPKVLGSVEVPFSMIGPPTSVAVSHDGSFALVTNSQKINPADNTAVIPDDEVSLVDLTAPAHPRVVETMHAGAGATGVAINRAATLALVANVNAGTVSVFTIADKKLTLADTVQLDPKPGPCDVVISPDGKTALVTQRNGFHVWRLAIDGTKVSDTGVSYATGTNPYGSVFSQDGRYAYNTNLLGRTTPEDLAGQRQRGPRVGTVTVIDLTANTVPTTVEVGPTPENVAMSPNGRYLAVTVVNGSSARPTMPSYNNFGLLKIYRIEGPNMTQVAEAKTGAWGQGATWSRDGRVILLQTAIDKTIEVYKFDGKGLTRDTTATLTFTKRPGAIMTPWSR
jgi:DNA-binding beta-propeller fold protein YncE